MSNVIYIVAVDGEGTKVKCSDYAQYSIHSWQVYCDKYGIDLLVLHNDNLSTKQEIYDIPDYKHPIWYKEYIYKFGLGYDKIGIVDSDTIISPTAPNIFDLFNEDQFCGVNDIADLNWLFKSIEDRQSLFPEIKMDINSYINAGVLFFGSRYLNVFENLLSLYNGNREVIEAIKGGGKEQTLLNFTLQEMEVPITLLNPEWNLLSIHKKNMFKHNWQLNLDKTPHFIKYAYVWHFTGFPIEDRINAMKQVYEYLFRYRGYG